MRTISLAGVAISLITGCAQFSPQPQDIPLAAVIRQVRQDLQAAMADKPVTDMPLTEVTLNLKVSAVKTVGGSAGVTTPSAVPVELKFNTQATGTMENTVILKFSGDGPVLLMPK